MCSILSSQVAVRVVIERLVLAIRLGVKSLANGSAAAVPFIPKGIFVSNGAVS
jgi:hypothetical protein